LRPGLNPRPVRINCVMDNVAVGQVFNWILRFSLSASFHVTSVYQLPASSNATHTHARTHARTHTHTHTKNKHLHKYTVTLLIYSAARKHAWRTECPFNVSLVTKTVTGSQAFYAGKLQCSRTR
jgi:hypothetical protein